MNTGTVKWFDEYRGFGFIQLDGADDDDDVFVHVSAVQEAGLGTLHQGERVSFNIVKDRRSGKTKADNLRTA
jgi:cold shock protein